MKKIKALEIEGYRVPRQSGKLLRLDRTWQPGSHNADELAPGREISEDDVARIIRRRVEAAVKQGIIAEDQKQEALQALVAARRSEAHKVDFALLDDGPSAIMQAAE